METLQSIVPDFIQNLYDDHLIESGFFCILDNTFQIKCSKLRVVLHKTTLVYELIFDNPVFIEENCVISIPKTKNFNKITRNQIGNSLILKKKLSIGFADFKIRKIITDNNRIYFYI